MIKINPQLISFSSFPYVNECFWEWCWCGTCDCRHMSWGFLSFYFFFFFFLFSFLIIFFFCKMGFFIYFWYFFFLGFFANLILRLCEPKIPNLFVKPKSLFTYKSGPKCFIYLQKDPVKIGCSQLPLFTCLLCLETKN